MSDTELRRLGRQLPAPLQLQAIWWWLMLQCYLDASGKGESGISCVAGYLAPVGEWAKLKLAWLGVLQDYGIDCFHQRAIRQRISIAAWSDLECRLKLLIGDFHVTAIGAAIVDSHWSAI